MFKDKKGKRTNLNGYLKSTKVLNTGEDRKLSSSVEKFQKECEKKLRSLAIEQTKLQSLHGIPHGASTRRSSVPVNAAKGQAVHPLSSYLTDKAIHLQKREGQAEISKPTLKGLLASKSPNKTDPLPRLKVSPATLTHNNVNCDEDSKTIAGKPEQNGSKTFKNWNQPAKKITGTLGDLSKPSSIRALDKNPTRKPTSQALLPIKHPLATPHGSCASFAPVQPSPPAREAQGRWGFVRRRLNSCPNIGNIAWASGNGEVKNEQSELEKRMNQARYCRYLRLPSCPEEDGDSSSECVDLV